MDGSIMKEFTKYVSLNILGMIGLSCYILADTYFVANALGAIGLASLNLSIPIYNIINGLGLLIGIGGATRFSILKSRGNHKKADIVFSTAIQFGMIMGGLLILTGLLASKYLAFVLGADHSTLSYTQIYLTTILSFSPFVILNNVVLAFVRNDQNPNLPMVAMLVGSFSNIVLDYIFMFPLKMGIFGAALATGLAPIISLFILMFHFLKQSGFLFLKNKIRSAFIPDIVNLGLSAFIIEISSAVVLVTFNLIILNLEGNVGVAAYGIIANLALVGIAIFTGLAQGIQPLTSRYYGSKDYKKVKKVCQYAIWTAVFLALTIYLSVLVYTDSIIAIFNKENNLEIIQIAENGLKIYFLGFFFAGVNIVTAMYLSATEKGRGAFILSIARGVIIIVPLVFILSVLLHMTGVWLSFVMTEFIVTNVAIYFAKSRKKRL